MIEFRPNNRYQIFTPEGFKDFSGMRKTSKKEVVRILLSNSKVVEASLDHKFVVEGKEIVAKDLVKGALIHTGIKVEYIEFKKGDFTLFDLTDVSEGHLFFADNIISHNCDFLTSGDTVFLPQDLLFYETTNLQEPIERRGVDGNLWIWEGPDYSTSYMVVADVARGDSLDYSTFHVFDIEKASQVAEFKSKISPKDFGNVLVAISSEYNDALLVVENANVGWATIEQILSREYKNLYYSSKAENETVDSYMSKFENDKLVPGFVTSMRTRPLLIAKAMEYVREHSVTIRSKRLLEEMRVFVWKNGKAQSQIGYNDDLVMAFSIGLFVRDSALRLRQQGMDLTRAQLSSFTSLNQRNSKVISTSFKSNNPFKVTTGYGEEDISWVLK